MPPTTNLLLLATLLTSVTAFDPNWDSLDTRPLPTWYDDAKIGIFLHWGVFSVPSFGSEWFWSNWKGNNSDEVNFMQKNYPPGFSYQEFAKEFTAEFFEPDKWAELFAASGARYIVLTSKHHEGFTLWPSRYSYSWNAMDIGPHRDLIGDLAAAVRDKNLKFGLYHSLYEWFHPVYQADKATSFKEQNFVRNKILPEMHELIENYKPSVLWSDGDWEAPDTYWNSTEFLAWLYNESPVKDEVVVNDRWGIGIPCKHGDFYSCADRYNPGTLQPHKWENAMTIDSKSWGFRRNAPLSDYLTTHDLIITLAETVSCGGNLLMNVGPTKDGVIAPVFEQRLREFGQWLDVNGEAIYGTTPFTVQNDTTTSGVWYTAKDSTIYAVVLDWPAGNELSLDKQWQQEIATVEMLGVDGELKFTATDNIKITFPDKATTKCDWAWVLKITTVPQIWSKLIID